MSEKEGDPKLSPQVFYGETLLSPLTAHDGNQVSLTNNSEVPMCKDEGERKFIGEQISWQYETQLVNLVQYAGGLDELTKQLTDYIFLPQG